MGIAHIPIASVPTEEKSTAEKKKVLEQLLPVIEIGGRGVEYCSYSNCICTHRREEHSREEKSVGTIVARNRNWGRRIACWWGVNQTNGQQPTTYTRGYENISSGKVLRTYIAKQPTAYTQGYKNISLGKVLRKYCQARGVLPLETNKMFNYL